MVIQSLFSIWLLVILQLLYQHKNNNIIVTRNIRLGPYRFTFNISALCCFPLEPQSYSVNHFPICHWGVEWCRSLSVVTRSLLTSFLLSSWSFQGLSPNPFLRRLSFNAVWWLGFFTSSLNSSALCLARELERTLPVHVWSWIMLLRKSLCL